MRESKRYTRRLSRGTPGTIVLKNISEKKLPQFGVAVVALWPDEPAATLARRARCTKRHANLLIEGKRKPNARAALAVYAEIIG